MKDCLKSILIRRSFRRSRISYKLQPVDQNYINAQFANANNKYNQSNLHPPKIVYANFSGYGIFINSTVGGALIESCTIEQNGADGIKYVHHEETAYSVERNSNPLDFCTFPTTSSQTYPIHVNFEQNLFSTHPKECHQVRE